MDVKVSFKLPPNPEPAVLQGLETGIRKATQFMQTAVQVQAPAENGALRESIQTEIRPMAGNVFQNKGVASYGNFVHDGTGIYGKNKTPIVPVTANYMTFKIGGTQYFRKSVKGQKPNRYFNKAFLKDKKKAVVIISRAISARLEGGKW